MIRDVVSLPVRKSVLVNVSLRDAFEIFTTDVDTWWPRTHHIGKTVMTLVAIEPFVGGRCYSRHAHPERQNRLVQHLL